MTTPPVFPSQPRVVALIVVYHPEPGHLLQLLAAIRTQVASIVLVCNSATAIPADAADTPGSVTIIQNPANIGLAAAQNQGIDQCNRMAADYVLFLDQDSLPGPSLVSDLLAADQRLAEHGIPVGGVAPLLVDAETGTEWPYLSARWLRTQESTQADGLGACRADMLYSSGSLVRLMHFRTVGNFMEHLFIDHVDLEWCYRAAAHGLRFFGIPAIRMQHRMGHGHIRFLGRLHPLHSTPRDYYVFRNSVILLGLRHIPLRWKINELVRQLPRAIFYSLLGQAFFPHLSSCLRGIANGLRFHLNSRK